MTVAAASLITGTNHTAFQISKDVWNAHDHTFSDGSAGVGGIAFTSQTSLNLWRISTGNAGFSGSLQFTGVVGLSDGTSSLPALTFTGEATLGMWRIGAAQAGFAGSFAIKGPRPWADVDAYGADPTGVAFSVTAIQAATAAVFADGGGDVLFSKSYRVDASLTIPGDSISYIGRGIGATTITSTFTTGAVIKSSAAVQRNFFRCVGMKIVAATNTGYGSAIGIDMSGFSSSRLEDVWIRDFGVNLKLSGVSAACNYNYFDHTYIDASTASSGYIGVTIDSSANAQTFVAGKFSRLDRQVRIGNTGTVGEVQFFGCQFENGDAVCLDVVNGDTVRVIGGRFETNVTAVKVTATASNSRGIVIDGALFASNTTDIDDAGCPGVVRIGNASGSFVSYAGGVSTKPGQNLIPNAGMEGWTGTTDLLGWTSASSGNWDTTGFETQESTIKSSGSFSVRGGNGTTVRRGVATPAIAVDPTKPYSKTYMWTTPSTTTCKMQPAIRLMDSASATITTGTLRVMLISSTGLTSIVAMTYNVNYDAHVLGTPLLPAVANTMERRTEVFRFPTGVAFVRHGWLIDSATTTDYYLYLDDVHSAEGETTYRAMLTPLGDSGTQNLYGVLNTADGTVSLPAHSFTSDPDTGLYRIGANNAALAANGTKLIEWNATQIGFFAIGPATRASAYTQTYATATKTHSNPTATALTDNTLGTANTTLQALTDPADAPATADALRDDLVANLIPQLRNNYADLAAAVNALIVDHANTKGVLNSVIDDNQAYGLLS